MMFRVEIILIKPDEKKKKMKKSKLSTACIQHEACLWLSSCTHADTHRHIVYENIDSLRQTVAMIDPAGFKLLCKGNENQRNQINSTVPL